MPVNYNVNQYPIVDLLSWHATGSLDLSPKFQRNPVWKLAAKGQLIDTILRGFPLPPIHIRLAVNSARQSERQVIDGQQRLRAIIDFANGRLRISTTIASQWAGMSFDDLTEEEKDRLLVSKIFTYQYENLSDSEVLEIFSRLNKYSVALNPQELRNGKFFGQFISTSAELSHETLEFWRSTRVFTEQAIARMQDIQLVSELLICQMDGFQDKKASIDAFCAWLDEDWGDDAPASGSKLKSGRLRYLSKVESINRYRFTINAIGNSIGDELRTSAFNRAPLFYTLYAVMYHHLFGLPGFDVDTGQRMSIEEFGSRFRESILELSEALNDKGQADYVDSQVAQFITASSQQTDNVQPREVRARVLWNRTVHGL